MDPQSLFPIPDPFQARRVLCVQPHYDDNDIGAGGAIAALHARGAEITYLTVTDDLAGLIDPALTGEVATAQLRREQAEAGAEVGVSAQYWLDFPDAGPLDYYEVRRGILRHIRLLRPDLVLTVDPWLPYEAHSDHRLTGLAAAEAVIHLNTLRIPGDPEVDRAYEPYEMLGIGFYHSDAPNTFVDITAYREAKYRAMAAYRAQLTPETLAQLQMALDLKWRRYGERLGCEYAEGLRLLAPRHLHCYADAW